MNPEVSVVIATYERRDLLLRCADALLAQTLAAARFEIVIVDDGSSRATREYVMAELSSRRRLRRAPTLRFLWLPSNRGPAAARNCGILAARGGVIAFTDDDTVPHANWLESGLDAIRHGADAVAGAVEVPLPAVPTDYERDAAGLSNAGFVTANCFVRRDLLCAVGGFDERFRCAWREDTDLFFRLRASGAIVRASHAARVVHPVRPARWGVSLAQQRKVMFDALLYKKFPQGYRRYVRARPPWDYYCAVVAGLCALVNAVAGFWLLALACLVAWLGISVAFASRRLADTSHAPRHVAEMIVTSLLIPWVSVYWRTRGALRFRVPFV
ncbi:MAG TPA: glycosyltransferase [Casimicrobiaceae bacterium]|nr:glycosyltransferase [Casimicrobiaceae bacterium]